MESVSLMIRVNISSKSFFFNTFSWIALLLMVDRLANPFSRDAILYSMVPSLSSNRFNSSNEVLLQSCASLSMADRLEPASPFSRDAILAPNRSSFIIIKEVLREPCAVGILRPCFCTRP
ncbi:hypothetical protein EGW08_019357, partial [Elysia chlorotica]